MRDTLDHDYLFLSPEQLKLDPVLYRGLIKVADGLELGEYEHVSSADYQNMRRIPCYEALPAEKKLFNMKHWYSGENECGTVGCIGGWLDATIGPGALLLIDDHQQKCRDDEATDWLDALFHPQRDGRSLADDLCWWDTITPTQAAHQIRHYLRTGNVDWNESLRSDQARKPKS